MVAFSVCVVFEDYLFSCLIKKIFDLNLMPHMKTSCSYPGCDKEGLYPAPFSPLQPRPLKFYCLEHIRQHNANWNFLGGLTEKQVEDHIRRATVWERPSWPFGKGPLSHKSSQKPYTASANNPAPKAVIAALALFGLKEPVTTAEIKKRHRELVKQHHPDTNGGKSGEARQFHLIQEAFTTLKKYYAPLRKPSLKTGKQ
jgi:DnaJ-domain-containing protein 1